MSEVVITLPRVDSRGCSPHSTAPARLVVAQLAPLFVVYEGTELAGAQTATLRVVTAMLASPLVSDEAPAGESSQRTGTPRTSWRGRSNSAIQPHGDDLAHAAPETPKRSMPESQENFWSSSVARTSRRRAERRKGRLLAGTSC